MKPIDLPTTANMEEIIANSFKDYHTKGFDYLCVRRTPTETLKLYFFDGDVSKLPEVVNPHDHRYGFDSYVLAGATENIWFKEGGGKLYNRFAYMTKLNGGNGFTEAGTVKLRTLARGKYTKGNGYAMRADELHTIRIVENESVLMLRQYEDVVPLDQPTMTYCLSDQPPSLDGLYSRFTPDEVIAKLKNFHDRTGISLSVE
jgi:hypothetical protein